MVNQELTTKEIVEKDFNSKLRGYDPDEVDEFLDVIIRDYDSFITEINNLREQNTQLEDKVERIERERDRMADRRDDTVAVEQPQTETEQAYSNYDILKRLSNLEREVFGSKLNREN